MVQGEPAATLPAFIARRLVGALVGVLLTLILLFLLIDLGRQITYSEFARGSLEQRAALAENLGLDRGTPERFVAFVAAAVSGDWGTDADSRRSVAAEIAESLWPSLLLVGTSIGVAIAIAKAWGSRAAFNPRPNSIGRGTVAGSLIAAPPSWAVGVGLLLLVSLGLEWLPVGGYESPGGSTGFGHILDVLHHLALPTLALSLALLGEYFFIVRSHVSATKRNLVDAPEVSRSQAARAARPEVARGIGRTIGYAMACFLAVAWMLSYPGLAELGYRALQEGPESLLIGVVFTITLICLASGAVTAAIADRRSPVAVSTTTEVPTPLLETVRRRPAAKVAVGLIAVFAITSIGGVFLIDEDTVDITYGLAQPRSLKPSWLLTDEDRRELETADRYFVAEPSGVAAIGTWEYPLGTDAFGRSIFSRVMIGIRVSLVWALEVAAAAGAAGLALGWGARSSRRWMRGSSDWLIWYLGSIPALFIALVYVFYVRDGEVALALILGVFMSAGAARAVRAHARPSGKGRLVGSLAHLVAPLALVAAFALFYESVIAIVASGAPYVDSLGYVIESALRDGSISLGTGWWYLFPAVIILTTLIFSLKLLAHTLEERRAVPVQGSIETSVTMPTSSGS